MKLKQIKISHKNNRSDRQINFNRVSIVDNITWIAIIACLSPLISAKAFDDSGIKSEITVIYKHINYIWTVLPVKESLYIGQLKYLLRHIEYEKKQSRNSFVILSYFTPFYSPLKIDNVDTK